MYIFDETDGSLAHYGVKGMKWGVRKELKPIVRPTGVRIADRHARNKYADLMGLSGPMQHAKRSRSGVHKITNVR